MLRLSARCLLKRSIFLLHMGENNAIMESKVVLNSIKQNTAEE